jgi:hypothetical protein
MRAWMPASRRGLTCRRQRPERGPSRAPLKPPPPHQPDEGRDTYDRDDPEAAGTDPPGRDVRARNSASRDGATRLAVAAGDSRSPRRETSDGTPRSISRFVQSEHVIRHMPGWEIPGEASALARHQTAPAASGRLRLSGTSPMSLAGPGDHVRGAKRSLEPAPSACWIVAKGVARSGSAES